MVFGESRFNCVLWRFGGILSAKMFPNGAFPGADLVIIQRAGWPEGPRDRLDLGELEQFAD